MTSKLLQRISNVKSGDCCCLFFGAFEAGEMTARLSEARHPARSTRCDSSAWLRASEPSSERAFKRLIRNCALRPPAIQMALDAQVDSSQQTIACRQSCHSADGISVRCRAASTVGRPERGLGTRPQGSAPLPKPPEAAPSCPKPLAGPQLKPSGDN